MRTLAVLPLLVLGGCWDLDAEEVVTERVAFTPNVGAPVGWWVEGFEMDLTCPDGSPARFYLVYPDHAVRTDDGAGAALPVAVVYHSGAIDFVASPTPEDPVGNVSWQESLGRGPRLSATWAARRVFATLGLYPNYDPAEVHVGTLAAALATKGIASLWPINCWGDGWHNRSSVVENDFPADLFFRDGRTAAEFAYLHAAGPFPPGNPRELPVTFDRDRIYLVGLGDGARAVGEVLTARDADGRPLYAVRAAVLDTPADDWRVLGREPNRSAQELGAWRQWAQRVFADTHVNVGAPSKIPPTHLERLERLGILLPAGDAGLPVGINADLRARFLNDEASPRASSPDGKAGIGEIWVYETIGLKRPLSNADPLLAKAVADFLGAPSGGGIEAVEALEPGLVH